MTNQEREDVFNANVALGVDPLTAYAAANDSKRKPWLTWKLAALAVLAECLSIYVLWRMLS